MRFSSLALLFLGALIIGWSAQAAPPPAEAGENLIADPGFENPDAHAWTENNWAHLDAEFARDPVNPHSGSYSERLILRRAGSDSFLGFYAGPLEVKPGMALQVRCWTRGVSNTAPLELEIRKLGKPYTTYWSTYIEPSDAWKETSVMAMLSQDIDPHDVILMVDIPSTGTYWLDDVSLVEAPASEGGAPLEGNQLRNGSFEVGRDGWYATFRSYANPAGATPAMEEANIGEDTHVVDVPGAPWGRRALSFEVKRDCAVDLTSAFFKLRYGHPATISFWAKTGRAGQKLSVALTHEKSDNATRVESGFTAPDTAWNFYSFTTVPMPSSSGSYVVEFQLGDPGTVLLDGVVAVEGNQPLKNPPVAAGIQVGTQPAPNGDPANIFYKDEAAAFTLNVLTDQDRVLEARVIDPWDQVIGQFEFPVKRSTDVPAAVPLSLPTGKFGGFKCVVSEKGGSDPLAEIIYTVVPKLPPPSAAGDSFFGGHAYLSPYNLHIAERAGFRWLRLYCIPLNTMWVDVEPAKGLWDFNTVGLKRAHDMGFHLLGILGSCPAWCADGDPAVVKKKTNWYTCWPPADWSAWEEYVQRTQEAFAPYVDHWEIWNEPNGPTYLMVPPGRNVNDVYMKIVRTAREATKPRQDREVLIGGVDSSFRYVPDILKKGVTSYSDVFSFHDYDESFGNLGPDETGVLANLPRISQYKNRQGKPTDIWITESGVFLNGGESWLDTAQVPPEGGMTIGDVAAALVRSAIAFKAAGVKKFFVYRTTAQPSGRHIYVDDCDGMIDANGIPLPSLAAHAAMVSFLDGAAGAGCDVIPVGNAKVTVAHFTRAGKRIEVVWSREPANLGAVPGLDFTSRRVFDLMGNSIQADAGTPLTTRPIYLLE